MPDNRWSTLARIVPNLDDDNELNGTGVLEHQARMPSHKSVGSGMHQCLLSRECRASDSAPLRGP